MPSMPVIDPAAPPGTIEHPRERLLPELLNEVEERGQVIVHCQVHAPLGEHIRIWPSTFLVCRRTGHRAALLHAEGIVMPPHWMPVGPGSTARFTLIFDGLPKGCDAFDLVEQIPEPGGFSAHDIRRNRMDVYRVRLD